MARVGNTAWRAVWLCAIIRLECYQQAIEGEKIIRNRKLPSRVQLGMAQLKETHEIGLSNILFLIRAIIVAPIVLVLLIAHGIFWTFLNKLERRCARENEAAANGPWNPPVRPSF